MTATDDGFEHEQLPPHDIQAEMAVLGSMMSSPDALAHCLEVLRPQSFFRQAHQLIFEACAALADAGQACDWLTVKAELERRKQITQAGGPLKLHDCLQAVPFAGNAPVYAAQVAGYQVQREVEMVSARIGQIARAPEFSPQERVDAARAALDDALAPQASTGLRPISEVVVSVIGTLERGEVRGVQCGIRDLDELTGGFAAGELVLVAARPGVGKSVLIAGFAKHAVMKLGIPVLLASLEMSAEEITLRLISADSRVPLFSLVQRRLTDSDWRQLLPAAKRISESPLVIDDTPGMTLAGIRSRLRQMARTAPAQMLVVDYLGLLDSPRAENRQAAVAALSRGPEAHRPRVRDPRRRRRPAEPQARGPAGQAPAAVRPARVRGAGAGRRHHHPAAPRGRLRPRVTAGRRDRPDRGEEPAGPEGDPDCGFPGPLRPDRQHGEHRRGLDGLVGAG